jgi:hypothetical protein
VQQSLLAQFTDGSSECHAAERFSEGAVNEVVPQAIRHLIDHWEAITELWKS